MFNPTRTVDSSHSFELLGFGGECLWGFFVSKIGRRNGSCPESSILSHGYAAVGSYLDETCFWEKYPASSHHVEQDTWWCGYLCLCWSASCLLVQCRMHFVRLKRNRCSTLQWASPLSWCAVTFAWSDTGPDFPSQRSLIRNWYLHSLISVTVIAGRLSRNAKP